MLHTENLTKHFGETAAVEGLNLDVAPGEIYGLVGPDGAGKTTTIRLLVGALHPDDGTIRVAGYEVPRRAEKAREHLGYLPQRFSLYEELTVLENLRFFAEVRGLSAAEWLPRSMEILEFVGLARFSARRAGQLSGGMKQKLGLAAALVHKPRLLLLDEPTTGVDPVTRQDFWQLIIRLVSEEGVAVLVSTPYMDEAARCNRLGFLREGRLLVEGTPTALRRQLEGRILELRGENLRALRSLAEGDPIVEHAHLVGDRIHLRVQEGSGNALKAAAQLQKRLAARGGAVTSLLPVAPTLEDVFISLSSE